jgi:aspartyl protease family protein
MDMRNQFLEPERGSGIVGWTIKQLVIWLGGGIVVYTLAVNHQLFQSSSPQTEARPAAASPRPLHQSATESSTLSLRARPDGHVLVNAFVNGVQIPFIVDTGATLVSLTQADAQRIGVAGGLSYTITMSTANGTAKAAPVTLHEVRIGELEVADVHASVMQAPGGISLLGQSFLKRLQSYEMRDGVLTLTWQ